MKIKDEIETQKKKKKKKKDKEKTISLKNYEQTSCKLAKFIPCRLQLVHKPQHMLIVLQHDTEMPNGPGFFIV